MKTVKILLNNSKSRILFEPENYDDWFQQTMFAIDNRVSFFKNGYEQSKEYNTVDKNGNRKWDGKIHTFNPYPYNKPGFNNLLPFEFFTGKYVGVLEVLLKNNYYIEFIDKRVRHPKTYDWTWNPDLKLWDYQEIAVVEACKRGRGILRIGTGGGKTNIGAGIIHRLGVAPFLFFVTSKDLMEQAIKRFESVLQMPIGKVGDGHCDIREINVCTIQTCFAAFGKEEEFKEQSKAMKELTDEEIYDKTEGKVDVDKYEEIRNLVRSAKGIIFDEIHHVPADTCIEILNFCENAFYRFGLGATVERDDGMEGMTEAIFGEYIVDYSPSFLIEKGVCLAPEIYIIPCEEYLGECETYSSEYKTYITENEFRNKQIADIANQCVKEDMPTLILVRYLRHGQLLKDLISEHIPSVEFIQGKLSSTKRKKLIERMQNRELMCAIATSLADEGLDIPCLEALIKAGSGRSIVKNKQQVGRVTRKDWNNPRKRAVVYDFMDLPPILHAHSLKRKNIYKSEPRWNVYDLRYKKDIQAAMTSKKIL